MTLVFHPHPEDADKGSLMERIDVLMNAAQLYRASVLDLTAKNIEPKKITVPRELDISYNWEEIARVLRETRELPEGNKVDKERKSQLLTKLAEVYEILRAAKMSKLEAVRLALVSEANQLRGGAAGAVKG
jgi:hypothetical protein